jgi:hypothetical protein
MKHLKIYYNISSDGIDKTCLNKCFAEELNDVENDFPTMCGSHNCRFECPKCFGSGNEYAMFLSRSGNKHRLSYEQGWIYCGATYNDRKAWRFKRLMYKSKLTLNSVLYRMFKVRIVE